MNPRGPVGGLAFAPDGALWRGGYGALWRGPTRVPTPLEQVHALALAPDGRALAAAGGRPGRDGALCLVDARTGALRRRIGGHADLAMAVAWAPDGTRLLTAGHDGSARLWSADGAPRARLDGHSGPVLAAAFFPDGAACLTAGADASVRVWEPGGRLLRTLDAHTDRVVALAVRPRAEGPVVCASAGRDRTVRLWQPERERLVRTLRFPAGIASLAWSADGARLWAGGEDGILRTLDGDSDAILAQATLSRHWLTALALAPDGASLAVGDSAGRVLRHSLR